MEACQQFQRGESNIFENKQFIYQLINDYLDEKIECEYFCNLFSEVYNLKIDYDSLNKIEREQFKELAMMSSRFSPFETDLSKYDCYFGEVDIRKKTNEVRAKLMSNFTQQLEV